MFKEQFVQKDTFFVCDFFYCHNNHIYKERKTREKWT